MVCRRIAGIAVSSVILLAATASAQPHRFYLGGGVIADQDRTNATASDATVMSWTIVAGLDVSSHFGLRMVFEDPHDTTTLSESTRVQPPSFFPVRERLTRRNQTRTYGVSGDVHGWIRPSLRLAGTFGFTTIRHDITSDWAERIELRPDGTQASLPDRRDNWDADWYGLSAGLEAALTLRQRFELVPEVRIIYFGKHEAHPYVLRSGIGMRWRF
jgi:hypothetical protein